MLENYDQNRGPVHREGCGVPQNETPRDIVHLHRRPPPASTGYCSSSIVLLQPAPTTVHPWAPVHPASTARSSTGYYSTSPLHGVLFNHPSTGYCSSNPPPAIVQPALHWLLFNLPSMGSYSSSRPRDPVHPRATGSTDRGPVHPVATPRGPFHPTPAGNCTSKPHNNAHCSSRGSIDRLQLAAVAKESVDRSGSVTRRL